MFLLNRGPFLKYLIVNLLKIIGMGRAAEAVMDVRKMPPV
jgi:hypothetical protein